MTIHGDVENVYVAGASITIERGRGPGVETSSASFDAELDLAKKQLRQRHHEEANATLERLVARADAASDTAWSVRARLELVWQNANPGTKAEAEGLLDECEALGSKATLPAALLGSMLRVRCRLRVMTGDAEAEAVVAILAEYAGSEAPHDDQEAAYQILRAGTDLAMLQASFGRWDDAESALHSVEEAAATQGPPNVRISRVLHSVEEVRLRLAIEHGNLAAVERIADAWARPKDKEGAEDIANALQHYANMARHLTRYDCGIVCAAAASLAARAADLDDFVLAADQTQATLLCLAGRVAEGLRLNDVVTHRAEASNSSKVIIAGRLLAADHALQQDDGAVAREHAEAALEAARGDEMAELMVRQCLADACQLQGDFPLAHAHVAEALRLGERLGLPPKERLTLLHRAVDLVGQEGAWDDAERYLGEWARVAPATESAASELAMAHRRVDGYRQLHATFESLKHQEALADRTSSTVHEGLSELVKPVLEWWDDLGRASPDQLDYWGRGNGIRVLKHLSRYPRALTIVVEARSRADIERALRLCGLVADVIVVLWKGACKAGRILAVAPMHHDGPGGAGYILAPGTRMRGANIRGSWVPALAMSRLLPDDITDLLGGEGRRWFQSGRLMIFPAWSVGCINPGFGSLERLLTETIRGIPVVRSTSQRSLPWQMVPWFPEVPLQDLADVADDPQFNRPRLRHLFMERSHRCASTPTISVVRELEQEIEAELLELRDRVARHQKRHGWATADERWTSARVHASPRTKPDEPTLAPELSPWRPFLRIGELGYDWQIRGLAAVLDESLGSSEIEQDRFEGAGEWLAPEDERPRLLLVREE